MLVFLPVAWLGAMLAVPAIAVHAANADCPDQDALERALAQVGAQSSLDPAAWTLSVAADLSHGRASRDPLRVALSTPSGETALVRTVVLAAGSCEAAANAVAFIVERYFRDVGWTAGTPAPVTGLSSGWRAPERGAGETLRGGDAPRWRTPRLAVSSGLAFWSRGPGFVAEVELRARVAGRVSAAVGALLPPAARGETLDTSNSVRLRMWPFLARLVASGSLGPLLVWAGSDGLFTLERSDRAAGLDAAQARWRGVLGVGTVAGAEARLSRRWRLGLELAGYRTLLGSSFVIHDASGTTKVLEPPAWSGLIALRLGWVFFE